MHIRTRARRAPSGSRGAAEYGARPSTDQELPLPRSTPAVLAVFALLAFGCGGDKPDTIAGKDGKPPIGASEDFSVKQSLVPKGASAGDPDAAEDYVPEGDLVADSGFRPTRDGFSFENYGNDVEPENLSPANVENLFGEQVCVSGTGDECQLIPPAQEWMENQNEAMAGGHCQGFSVTALRLFNELLDPNDFGASTTAGLEIVGNVGLQSTLAEHFTYQFLPPIVEGRVKGTPTQVLERLGEALNEGDELYTLGIYKADLTGGHAITPFAIEDKGDGRYAILVYDNNFPGVTRAVEVDTNDDSWSYVGGINPDNADEVYEGDASTQTLELDPTLPVEEEYSPCPFCTGMTDVGDGDPDAKGTLLAKEEQYTEITLSGDVANHPHLVFTDDEGRQTGIVDGRLKQEIPDVEVVKAAAIVNWDGAPEPRFRLPEGADYTITVDGTDLEKPTKADIDLIGNGLVIEVEEIALEPGQKDEMALPGGYGITYQANGDAEEAPNLYAGLVEDDAAYNFAASAVGIKPGSTLSLLVDQENKAVILDSTGSEGVLGGRGFFILQLTKADAQGRIAQWQAPQVRLNGSKEEKAGFEYDDSPTRGKALPIVVLDKDLEVKRIQRAKPA